MILTWTLTVELDDLPRNDLVEDAQDATMRQLEDIVTGYVGDANDWSLESSCELTL
jgi:hypothetical protein